MADLLATTPTRPSASVHLPALEPALLLAAAGSRTRSRFVDGLSSRPNGCGICEDRGPTTPSHSGRLRPSSKCQTIGGGSYLPKAPPEAWSRHWSRRSVPLGRVPVPRLPSTHRSASRATLPCTNGSQSEPNEFLSTDRGESHEERTHPMASASLDRHWLATGRPSRRS